jgi:hypothetical protein
MFEQSLQLLIDGLCIGLTLSGHTGIDGYSHERSPQIEKGNFCRLR